jgi:3'-phosphoadenosine 5'-phosphosulfate (PAPS) 3'-phosphatase
MWEESIISAVRMAGNAIEELKKSGVLCSLSKEDLSPVTLADQKADERLCSCLRTLDKGHVISEEGHEFELYGDKAWVVDPLDDTKDFISGSLDYTVNVALFN